MTSTYELAYRAAKLIMPCLRKLELYDCPKLEALLQHLNNTPLKQLSIANCDGIKGRGCSSSFPFIEEFTLIDSREFFSAGLPGLPKLKSLRIDTYSKETFPDGGWEQLEALQKLQIEDCDELGCLHVGWTQLQSLQALDISNCNKLESLPKGLGQLKKLKRLKVSGLEKLESLPDSLGQLKALKRLEICGCGALGSLPHGLRDLSLLQELEISSCPLRRERCKRKGGEDWPKISHIPYITIDGERLQRSRRCIS